VPACHNTRSFRLCLYSSPCCSPSDPSKCNQGRTQLNSIFPSAPSHRRPSRSATAFLHDMSATSPFLPFVHLNSPLPPPPRQVLEMAPHLHLDRVPLPHCHAIYLSHMPMLSLLLWSHEQRGSYGKVGRASQAVNQSEAYPSPRFLDCYHRSSWPKLIQKCASNASPQGCLLPSPARTCEALPYETEVPRCLASSFI